MKIYIVSRSDSFANGADGCCKVSQKLLEFGFKKADSLSNCDIAVTIGGDGTILKAGKEAAKAGKPLLGINTGRLGFMATLEEDEMAPSRLERLLNGDYTTSRRMLLDVEIDGVVHNALNDVVLHREQMRLPDFAVFRGETEVLKLRGDGIIVSTPTGSTAYSLSAGGPIIEPELECFLVTALCPHSLFNRPMVFSPSKPLRVSASDVSVSVDGYTHAKRERQCINNEVIITKSKHYLDLIDIDGDNFYSSIHHKLMKPLK